MEFSSRKKQNTEPGIHRYLRAASGKQQPVGKAKQATPDKKGVKYVKAKCGSLVRQTGLEQ